MFWKMIHYRRQSLQGWALGGDRPHSLQSGLPAAVAAGTLSNSHQSRQGLGPQNSSSNNFWFRVVRNLIDICHQFWTNFPLWVLETSEPVPSWVEIWRIFGLILKKSQRERASAMNMVPVSIIVKLWFYPIFNLKLNVFHFALYYTEQTSWNLQTVLPSLEGLESCWQFGCNSWDYFVNLFNIWEGKFETKKKK